MMLRRIAFVVLILWIFWLLGYYIYNKNIKNNNIQTIENSWSIYTWSNQSWNIQLSWAILESWNAQIWDIGDELLVNTNYIEYSWNNESDSGSKYSQSELNELLDNSKEYTKNINLTNQIFGKNQWKWNIYAYVTWKQIVVQIEWSDNKKSYNIPEYADSIYILDELGNYIYFDNKISNKWYILNTSNGVIIPSDNIVPIFSIGDNFILTIKDTNIWRYMISWWILYGNTGINIKNAIVDRISKYICITSDNSDNINIYNMTWNNIVNINKITKDIKTEWFVVIDDKVYIKSIDKNNKISISEYDMSWKLIDTTNL